MLEKASVFSMEEASAFWFSKPGSGSFLSLLLLQLPVRLGVDVALKTKMRKPFPLKIRMPSQASIFKTNIRPAMFFVMII
jgi:hypothetical protein